MTLDTRVYVHDELDVHAAFHYFRTLLGATDKHPFTDKPCGYRPGVWVISNNCGIGLPAWLMVYYRPGESLRPDANACDIDCYVSDDPAKEDEHCHKLAHWCEVSFDTGYSYRDDQGRNCGELHACLVAQFGQWLDGRGIAWSWQDECSGEIYGGEDRYAKLPELIRGGGQAMAWFVETVAPLIESGNLV